MSTLDMDPAVGPSSRAPAHGSRWAEAGDTPDEEISSPPIHERLREWTVAQLGEPPRFVTETRPSLEQQLAYSRHGEWTATESGGVRSWHVAFTRCVTTPAKFLAAWWEWICDRPGRFFPALALGVFLATALDPVPVIGWFVPDWAALTYWPPFSWIGG